MSKNGYGQYGDSSMFAISSIHNASLSEGVPLGQTNLNGSGVSKVHVGVVSTDTPASGYVFKFKATFKTEEREFQLDSPDTYYEEFTHDKSSGTFPVWIEYLGEFEDIPDCESNSDCPKGQKCADGECVDCDNVVSDEGYISLILRRSNGDIEAVKTSITYTGEFFVDIPDGYAHLKGVRFTSDSGLLPGSVEIRPIFRDFFGNISTESVVIGSGSFTQGESYKYIPIEKQLLFVTGYRSGLQINASLDTSAVGECSDDEYVTPSDDETFIEEYPFVEEFPPYEPPPDEPDPIDPHDTPDEPDPPAPWPEPWQPPYTPPDKPTPPDSPSSGCDCEIYLGSVLLQLVSSIYDCIWAAYDRLNTIFQFATGLYNGFIGGFSSLLKLLYDISLYFGSLYEAQQEKNREKADEIIDELKTFNAKFAEFADNYEPVQIENEYRTQSHRIIDNLDSTLNKL